jgi:nucleotide-binding universal stress UspA family protein
MFKKLICPTDFSESSYHALNWADFCAQKFGSELVVVHVLPYPEANFIASNFESYQAGAITSLNQFVKHLKAKYEIVLSCGSPWQKIVELSHNLGATGVVMGTRGLQGVAHKVFGSTTENVIRESNVPVVTLSSLCPVESQNRQWKVLIPVANLKAMIPQRSKVKEILRQLQANVTLMNVVEFKDPIFDRFHEGKPFNLIDSGTVIRKRMLSGRIQDLQTVSETIQINPSVVRFGDVSREIVSELQSEQYDLLVMSVRKKTLLSRFSDSIAYRVLANSTVPVITIKRNS